jgi:hypothetical protein
MKHRHLRPTTARVDFIPAVTSSCGFVIDAALLGLTGCVRFALRPRGRCRLAFIGFALVSSPDYFSLVIAVSRHEGILDCDASRMVRRPMHRQ